MFDDWLVEISKRKAIEREGNQTLLIQPVLEGLELLVSEALGGLG